MSVIIGKNVIQPKVVIKMEGKPDKHNIVLQRGDIEQGQKYSGRTNG